MMEGQDYMEDDEPVFHFDDEEDEIAAMNTIADEDLIENLEPMTPVGSADPGTAATAAAAGPGNHHEDLQQLDPYTLQHQHQAYETPPNSLPSRHQDGRITDADPVAMDEVGDYVEIPAEDYEQMFNGNEADRITAQKFQSEVIRAFQQNGRVVFMVGQATAQWWLSPEMQKRRRAAGRRMLDIGGAVASGAGNVIMNSTPVGGVVRSVSSNVSAFRASPLRYTMQGLGIFRKDAAAATIAIPTGTGKPMSLGGPATPPDGKSSIAEPAIVADDPYDEFDDEDGMGMFGALDMDEDEEL
ncbi:hypothetical protein SLS53_006968 [Cytospora paraplurivora]|uniref:Uncharacterized protein n=1 Tax=Cytospora paraplurivora TaxID=2898453 RepID=A0AAN9U8W8_9PEZI